MDEVTYGIYCLYTADNKIYVGMSKNPQVRIHQHFQKSCNPRLRKLIEGGKTQIFTRILHTGLTQEEASYLEKLLIRQYRNNTKYTILNIQSGGIRGNAKIVKPKKITETKNSTYLSKDDILKMRYKYSKFRGKIRFSKECGQYNISAGHFRKILSGLVRKDIMGPLLGKDYING